MATQDDSVTYTTIELLTPNGPEFRRVSTAPPRQPSDDEIPLISLKDIDNDLASRQIIAEQVQRAACNTGFFYICDHGISEPLIQNALTQAKAFFEQPLDSKNELSRQNVGRSVGYRGVSRNQINRTETRDNKETFSIQYDTRYDLLHSTLTPDTPPQNEAQQSHDAAWTLTAHLPSFRSTTITFFQARLTLARKLTRIFALALKLPEMYFDAMITHPGADALYIRYPAPPESNTEKIDVGIGSHTDIQLFTLLWQDAPGLQVLSTADEWLDARPVSGTLVVNVGDFLQRVSNDVFRSTVHRVYNHASEARISMAFFFGFNPWASVEVVRSCVPEGEEPKYQPIVCGEWRAKRFQLASGSST